MDRNDRPDDRDHDYYQDKKKIIITNDRPETERKSHHQKRQENYLSTIFIVLSLLIIGSVIVVNSIANNNYKYNVIQDPNIINDPNIVQPGITPGTESKLDLNEIIDNPAPEQEQQPSVTTEPSETDEEESAAVAGKAVDLTKITNPVASTEITMAYSLNADPVYSETFNEYRSDHAGIDLKAEIDEEVKSAYAGKVVEIRNDPKLGTTIKIDHGNNIFTEYANLATDVQVNLNDTVTAGQAIAKVGNTALYEISDGTHLHFALIVNDAYTNPTEYIK